MEENNYYIYRHRQKENLKVFYVGASKQENYKRAKSKRGRNEGWKVHAENGFDVEIMIENLSYEDACELENFLIMSYGRLITGKGTLTNVKKGGEITKSYVMSDETKKKISQKQKGENHHFYGKKRDKEVVKKIVESRRWYKHTDETKKKMSENRKKKHTGKSNWKSVEVINIETNEIYPCIKEAADKNNIDYQTLANMLSGRRKNTTNLKKL